MTTWLGRVRLPGHRRRVAKSFMSNLLDTGSGANAASRLGPAGRLAGHRRTCPGQGPETARSTTGGDPLADIEQARDAPTMLTDLIDRFAGRTPAQAPPRARRSDYQLDPQPTTSARIGGRHVKVG